jgi:hypothetical protein
MAPCGVVLDFAKSVDCQMTIDVTMEECEYEALNYHSSDDDDESGPEF